MLYKILADITVLVHFLWILFLIFGAIPGTRNRAVKILHLSGLTLALLLQTVRWYCPLTYLEIWLREQHDPAFTYRGSFIIHYVEQIVYLGISSEILFLLTAVVAVLNALLYLGKGRGRKSRQ